MEGLLDLELGLAPGAPPLDGPPGSADEELPATVSRSREVAGVPRVETEPRSNFR